ncbi:MAG: hypothetical protein II994_00140 [Lachnospiraceae bacterium]|nr:hypothetical protein [Lachnospiraceae bacterium]
MTTLLELREKIKQIYSRNEVYILPVIKFLLAFLVLNVLNGQLGYMKQLDNLAIVLVVSLACSFLPVGAMIFFATVFSLLHMYALSLEVALVGICVYLLMYLLFFRFSPKDTLAVVLTPLLCLMKVPYIMPVAMGLLGTPASAVSVSCGVVIYFLIVAVSTNATTISTMGSEEAAAKIRMIIDGLLGNKQLLVVIIAFAITVLLVYIVRKMSIDYSWTIAMIAGAMANLVILLVGDLLYDTNMSVLNAIFGAILAVIVGKIIEFFRFCVDYSRTEKVQFEDDEYYYYVKAVPKMMVTAPTKTVKKINTQRQSGQSGRGTSGARTSGGRSVSTEWTGSATRARGGASAQEPYRERRTAARSVTIKNTEEVNNTEDDYEELF